MGRPVTIEGPIGQLAKAVGGTGALCNLLGVSATTLRSWARGALTPTGRLLAERLASELQLPHIAEQLRARKRKNKRAPANPGETGGAVRITGPFGELAVKVGGALRLAQLLGVHQRSIYKWAQGVRMPGVVCGLLKRLAAEHDLSPAARRELARLESRRPDRSPSRPSSGPDHGGTLRTPSRRAQHTPRAR